MKRTMSISNEQLLNKMEPLREKKQKLNRLDKAEGWGMLYQWAKTDVVSESEFTELAYHLAGTWSI